MWSCHGHQPPHRYRWRNHRSARCRNHPSLCPLWQWACRALCRIDGTSTETLLKQVTELFDIPYADFEGKRHHRIQTIAIVPGCGDVVADMQEAELLGAQAYITGEIHCHINNSYGKQRYAQMMDYVPNTSLSLIGVSHSASEYLVMRTQMRL